MSADDLEQDDLSGVEAQEEEALAETGVEEVEDAGDAEEAEVAIALPSGKKSTKTAAPVNLDELPGLEAKQKEREALDKAIAEFLARGGKVQEIGSNVLADPPKKPENKYGSRPI